MPLDQDLKLTLASIGGALESIGVTWAIGGSFASTIHGESRSTNDIDVEARLVARDARRLVVALGDDFCADESMIAEAIAANDSFNVIDQRTFLKVDVFVPPQGLLGEDQLIRRQVLTLFDDLTLYVLRPEDTALQKLRWYQLSCEPAPASQAPRYVVSESPDRCASRLSIGTLETSSFAARLTSMRCIAWMRSDGSLSIPEDSHPLTVTELRLESAPSAAGPFRTFARTTARTTATPPAGAAYYGWDLDAVVPGWSHDARNTSWSRAERARLAPRRCLRPFGACLHCGAHQSSGRNRGSSVPIAVCCTSVLCG